MVEIYPNLFVGTTEDYEKIKSNEDFFTVIAAKEPYHRQAVGYRGRSCDKDNPEYLYAERERCLICNLVDVENPDWVSPVIINKAFDVIDKALFDDNKSAENGAVTAEELVKINQYARKELSPEEVYVFPVILCDTELDRDNDSLDGYKI